MVVCEVGMWGGCLPVRMYGPGLLLPFAAGCTTAHTAWLVQVQVCEGWATKGRPTLVKRQGELPLAPRTKLDRLCVAHPLTPLAVTRQRAAQRPSTHLLVPTLACSASKRLRCSLPGGLTAAMSLEV